MHKPTHITLRVAGTHCASCEVILERRLRKVAGVTKASVDYATGNVQIACDRPVSKKALAAAINKDGYRIADKHTLATDETVTRKDYAQIGGFFLLFIAAYLLFKRFDLLPNIGVTENMSLGLVFIVGLIAGTSTCLAVTGGLLLALAAKYSETNPTLSGAKKFKPAIYFAGGRVVGYAVFGAALGAFGSLFSFSPAVSGGVTVLAAVIMILLGLQLLRVVPLLNRIKVHMPTFLAHRVYEKTGGEYKPWAPFALGAGTFFVPCGFTQALQFYVLATGNALAGMLTMAVFALGTLPMLVALGGASSYTRGPVHKQFIRGAAVLVILLGIFSLPAGITLLRVAMG